jgi:glutaredoxin
MKIVKVSGKNKKHKVLVYALSTCPWCRLTKQFLKDNEIEYEYVDVDFCNKEDMKKIRKHILNLAGKFTYPTTIIDDKILINGFRKERIKEVLEI